jgi:tRNA-dihydrouridine synthase B
VVKTGAGAALMENPALLAESAGAMVRAAGQGKVGVKMRLGSMPGRETFIEAAARLRDAGAAWLTLHPRHASQGYSGTADWSSIRELTSATDLPVIASGDLMTAEQADRCLGETGASAVMFARGALRDPAVFRRLRELRAGIPPQPRSAGEIIELVLRHAELARTHAPGRRALLKMRTAVPKYVKGFQEASIMRKELVRIDSWRELEDLLRNRLKEKPEEIDSKVS